MFVRGSQQLCWCRLLPDYGRVSGEVCFHGEVCSSFAHCKGAAVARKQCPCSQVCHPEGRSQGTTELTHPWLVQPQPSPAPQVLFFREQFMLCVAVGTTCALLLWHHRVCTFLAVSYHASEPCNLWGSTMDSSAHIYKCPDCRTAARQHNCRRCSERHHGMRGKK